MRTFGEIEPESWLPAVEPEPTAEPQPAGELPTAEDVVAYIRNDLDLWDPEEYQRAIARVVGYAAQRVKAIREAMAMRDRAAGSGEDG